MVTVNIVYDNRINIDDYGRLLGEFIVQNITHYKFWDACTDLPVVVDCIAESHKRIVRDAKERGLKEVIIGEQDLCFPNPKGWEYFIENKPKEYDIYSGGSYLIDNKFEYKSPLVKVDALTGLHCYFISERYYDKFLDTPLKQHIDTAQKGGDFYLCFPYPALQNPSKSANNQHQMVNYNSILPDYFIYK